MMPTPIFAKEPDGSFSEPTRKAIVKYMYELLDEYSIKEYPSEHRNHLGSSVIGDPCSRKLWFGFRWVKLEQHEGRMRRLFNRGHEEEERFFNILTWMGFFVREIDPATNKQYKFSKVGGHYGGSSDSLMLLPWFRNEEDRILAEFKTHNIKSFDKLEKDGLKLTKPLHFAQMCSYGREFKTRYGLYCAVCKDNDKIFFDFVELDWQYAELLERKAQDIITSQIAPQRISEQPSFFECRYCNFQGVCHYAEPVERNCRSCQFAMPEDQARWRCTRFNDYIPQEFVKIGCDQHTSITNT